MLFNEPLFLFVFLPPVLGVFLLVRRRAAARAAWLLAASLAFYLWAEPAFVPVALLTCATDLVLARRIAAGSRWALPVGVAINLAMLGGYKYTGFAVETLGTLAGTGWAIPKIVLPIGVSFIAFEKISFLVDVSRRRSAAAPGWPRYLLYVFLFPKLLAGPIIKYHELEAQLRDAGHQRRGDLAAGFQRFMLGVVKKTLLADTLGSGADQVFGADPALVGFTNAWWGLLCFTFQIYLDFSAYSDMAIGLARMFGFRLAENFDRPYISRSVTEFWRRWHISLSTWIREYLYIPLGGNRVGPGRQYVNLWTCFLLSGLWHGAAWPFVAWGAYNGVFLVAERLFLLRWLARLPPVAATAWTFAVTMAGWLVFRSPHLDGAARLAATLLHPGRPDLTATIWRTEPVFAALCVAAALSFLPRVPGFDRLAARVMAAPPGRLAAEGAIAVLFVFALAKSLADPFQAFLYFRF